MRKPARNGNPGALDPNLAQQRRHFLRGKWRDPAMAEDELFLRTVMISLKPQQIAAATELLSEFSRWVQIDAALLLSPLLGTLPVFIALYVSSYARLHATVVAMSRALLYASYVRGFLVCAGGNQDRPDGAGSG